MSTAYGPFGQSYPNAATLSDLYMCPVSKHATIKVIACNHSTSETEVRIAIAADGQVDSPSQYVVRSTLGSKKAEATEPVTLGERDVVRVWSASGSVSFTANGIEADNT